MRALLLLILLLPFSASSGEVSILSWNLYMLPKPIKFSQQRARTRAIPELLSTVGTDVILLQEAFTSSVRTSVLRKLKQQYPYSFYLKKEYRPSRVFGSGVLLLSQHPIRVLDHVYFNWCASADCFASKGAALVEIELPGGRRVQIVNTHLQAIEGKGHIRLHQLSQIKAMMLRHQREGVLQILAGDLNIDVEEREFNEGLAVMDMQHTELLGPYRNTSRDFHACQEKTSGSEWIDHVWFSRQDDENIKATLEVKLMDYQRGSKRCPASDHHAIKARFAFAGS